MTLDEAERAVERIAKAIAEAGPGTARFERRSLRA
jgi:hypothetical protein